MFIQPSGHKSWKLRYRMGGRTVKQEKVVLGDYQASSLTEARTWRDDCKTLAWRSDTRPDDATPAAKELAQNFIRKWCVSTIEKARQQEAETKATSFARGWFQKIAESANRDPRNIKRALDKDVIPAIGTSS